MKIVSKTALALGFAAILLSASTLSCMGFQNPMNVLALRKKPINKPTTFTLHSAGIGLNDSYLLRVEVSIARTEQAVDTASKYAVYGLIFAGAQENGVNPAQAPMIEDVTKLDEMRKQWLANFFTQGRYLDFVMSVARHNIRITKVKKTFLAQVQVAVDKRKLRKTLEEADIIDKLGEVFDKKMPQPAPAVSTGVDELENATIVKDEIDSLNIK